VAQEAAFVDASPLIGLACVGGLVWLPKLYAAAFITRTVRAEAGPPE
jgi:predicted nucleic acid-binding protein